MSVFYGSPIKEEKALGQVHKVTAKQINKVLSSLSPSSFLLPFRTPAGRRGPSHTSLRMGCSDCLRSLTSLQSHLQHELCKIRLHRGSDLALDSRNSWPGMGFFHPYLSPSCTRGKFSYKWHQVFLSDPSLLAKQAKK